MTVPSKSPSTLRAQPAACPVPSCLSCTTVSALCLSAKPSTSTAPGATTTTMRSAPAPRGGNDVTQDRQAGDGVHHLRLGGLHARTLTCREDDCRSCHTVHLNRRRNRTKGRLATLHCLTDRSGFGEARTCLDLR